MAKNKIEIPDLRSFLKQGLKDKFEGTDITTGTADEVEYLAQVKNWVPTGIYPLDLMLSRGRGLPCGRFVEVSGKEGSGKTALCEFLAARYVREHSSNPHWLDFEKSYDVDHMTGYGVKKEDVFTPDTPTLENGWDYIGATLDMLSDRRPLLAKAGQPEDPPVLFVWDSIAQSVPKAELVEETAEDKHMAEAARAFAKAFRKYTRQLSDAKATLMFTNQVRDIPGARPGQKQTNTPGGHAIKFGCSTRLEMAYIEQLKNKSDDAIGHIAKITSTKNRFAPKKMSCELMLSYTRGIDLHWTNFAWFQDNGFITVAGNTGYKWNGAGIAFRRSDFAKFTADNLAKVEKARDDIYAKVLAKLESGPQTVEEEDDDEDAPSLPGSGAVVVEDT